MTKALITAYIHATPIPVIFVRVYTEFRLNFLIADENLWKKIKKPDKLFKCLRHDLRPGFATFKYSQVPNILGSNEVLEGNSQISKHLREQK